MTNLPNLPSDRKDLPIGIFDSGIGGMTVAQAITVQMPSESFIYFGDTAHLPYGDKSVAALQAYAIKITDMLLRQPVKAILIACNTASSCVFDLVQEYVGSRAKVYNVIDPIVEMVAADFAGKKVGLIGTRQTVGSNIYKQKLEAKDQHVHLQSLATPLLAPMVEEGFFKNNLSREVITGYLSSEKLAGIQALILACTHYPLIKEEIAAYYNGQVAVLDSSETVAKYVRQSLQADGLLKEDGAPDYKFFVSDYTQSFEESTRIFFGAKVPLELYPIWS